MSSYITLQSKPYSQSLTVKALQSKSKASLWFIWASFWFVMCLECM